MRFDLAEALWHLQLLPAQSLPEVAVDALMEGFDSPALIQLAGHEPEGAFELSKMFAEAQSELGRSPPSRDEAKKRIALDYCEKILSGACSPYEGARRIWWDLGNDNQDLDDLIPFVGLASEYEDSPAYRQQYTDEIVKTARELVNKWSPR